MAYHNNCPDCGLWGCSPDCPGPNDGHTICPNCGGSAAVRDGRIDCDACNYQERLIITRVSGRIASQAVLTREPTKPDTHTREHR